MLSYQNSNSRVISQTMPQSNSSMERFIYRRSLYDVKPINCVSMFNINGNNSTFRPVKFIDNHHIICYQPCQPTYHIYAWVPTVKKLSIVLLTSESLVNKIVHILTANSEYMFIFDIGVYTTSKSQLSQQRVKHESRRIHNYSAIDIPEIITYQCFSVEIIIMLVSLSFHGYSRQLVLTVVLLFLLQLLEVFKVANQTSSVNAQGSTVTIALSLSIANQYISLSYYRSTLYLTPTSKAADIP